jgi:hypothetical protein
MVSTALATRTKYPIHKVDDSAGSEDRQEGDEEVVLLSIAGGVVCTERLGEGSEEGEEAEEEGKEKEGLA